MKKNDLAEIKKMDLSLIGEKLKKAQKEVVSLVIDKNTNKLTNLKTIKNKRREIAQMMTIVRQKQLLQQIEVRISESKKKEVSKDGK